MKPKLEVGASWDRVKITDYTDEIIKVDLPGGYDLVHHRYFTARCDCGNEFKIIKNEWKGHKYIKDCGCGISAQDGEICIMNFSCAAYLRIEIKKYANHEGLNTSRAIVELIKYGLKYKTEQLANN